MISADFGRADEITDSKVDFPTDGKPTSPTSANTFNSSSIFRSCPGSPFSAISGAGFRGEAKRIFPRPPRPPLPQPVFDHFQLNLLKEHQSPHLGQWFLWYFNIGIF